MGSGSHGGTSSPAGTGGGSHGGSGTGAGSTTSSSSATAGDRKATPGKLEPEVNIGSDLAGSQGGTSSRFDPTEAERPDFVAGRSTGPTTAGATLGRSPDRVTPDFGFGSESSSTAARGGARGIALPLSPEELARAKASGSADVEEPEAPEAPKPPGKP